MARSTLDPLSMLKRLEHKKVHLHVPDQQIDTSTSSGMLLGTVAAFDNDLRKERQSDGMALA